MKQSNIEDKQPEILKKEYRLKGSPNRGLLMATFGFFIGFSAVSLFGTVASEFNKFLGLSGIMLGFLVGLPQLLGSLLRIPFGAWVDKVGGKKPMLILLGISIVGMVGLTSILYTGELTMGKFPWVLLFGLLGGAGVATFSVGVPQTNYWFPTNKHGFSSGVYGGLGNLAPGIFSLILPTILALYGLANTYLIWLLFLIAGTIIYAVYAKDAYSIQITNQGVNEREAKRVAKKLGQEVFPSGNAVDALKKSAKNPRTWALIALYFTSFGGFLALTTWLPTYWTEFHGQSVRMAGVLMAIGFSIFASLIRVYGGKASDDHGGEKVAIISFAVALLGALMFVVTSTFWIALLAEVILAAGMGIANAAIFKLVPTYVSDAPGGASGWVGGLGAFGGFVIPPVMGLFIDIFGVSGYQYGFLVFAALALLSIIISYNLMKNNPVKQ
ncbi:MFS transporter [Virgibacillus sp. NKC19-3]|uniref:MFS transporter n=1 Tax=Virgibacillus saliphilus TaxID=2831674 RepID=UPI001C9B7E56|nr:MFS transporter [Virgibacillus sp. NKC19-3]MBY7143104.1 MFS transporter [Virgibacillus sp. NKC19-3]